MFRTPRAYMFYNSLVVSLVVVMRISFDAKPIINLICDVYIAEERRYGRWRNPEMK